MVSHVTKLDGLAFRPHTFLLHRAVPGIECNHVAPVEAVALLIVSEHGHQESWLRMETAAQNSKKKKKPLFVQKKRNIKIIISYVVPVPILIEMKTVGLGLEMRQISLHFHH